MQGLDLDLDTVPSVLLSYLCIKRWLNDGFVIHVPGGWHPFACLVLVYTLQIVVMPK